MEVLEIFIGRLMDNLGSGENVKRAAAEIDHRG